MGDTAANPPVIRTICKKEAIRHLIHCVIRMVAAQEDAFAIHLLVHSAEKLLMDVAKHTGQKLMFNWEDWVVPGKESKFFNFHRETYNFLKHADRDFDKVLSDPHLAPINIAQLFICAENYRKLFDENTDHMLLMSHFMQVIAPQIFDLPFSEAYVEHIAKLGNATPKEFFDEGFKPNPLVAEIQDEITVDLADNGTLYHTPIPDLESMVSTTDPASPWGKGVRLKLCEHGFGGAGVPIPMISSRYSDLISPGIPR
jgi:hypothetical protein